MVEQIIQILSKYRFSISDEMVLQSQIKEILLNNLNATVSIVQSYQLDKKNIIDFLVNGEIGIEVKISGGRMDIFRQCERYCQFDKIKKLILVTSRVMGLPRQINDVDCYMVNLSKAWL